MVAAIRATVLNLLCEGGVHPQLVVLAVARATGEQGARWHEHGGKAHGQTVPSRGHNKADREGPDSDRSLHDHRLRYLKPLIRALARGKRTISTESDTENYIPRLNCLPLLPLAVIRTTTCITLPPQRGERPRLGGRYWSPSEPHALQGCGLAPIAISRRRVVRSCGLVRMTVRLKA
jgi:hypothetical protein